MPTHLPFWLLPFVALLAGVGGAALGMWLGGARARGGRAEALRRAAAAEQAADALTRQLDERTGQLLELREQLGRAEQRADQADALETALASARGQLADLSRSHAAQAATAREREDQAQAQIARLASLHEGLEARFKALAEASLRANEQNFLRLANETFARHQTGASAELGKARADIGALLAPVQETLKAYQHSLSALEQQRATEQGTLRAELKALAEAQAQVRFEAARLTQALRSNAQVRGAWGEAQLRNVLELAGLSPYADFQTQVHAGSGPDGAAQRPDVVVRLPGGHCLVVDAKTPLSAFLDAMGEADDERRQAHLARHGRALRDHARQLGQKAYHKQFETAPDYVIMFVPGEQFVAAALEWMPDLWVEAFESGVLIATPTNLIAIARTVAQLWRQERLGETAREIAALGEELYRRLAGMGVQVSDVGRALDRTVRSYNEFVGGLEARVMPQARRFTSLGIGTPDASLPVAEPLERSVRLPRDDRDLKLAPDPEFRIGGNRT